MNEKNILFNIIMPSKLFFSSYASIVTFSGTNGVFGVMRGHAPLIANLQQGLVIVKSDVGDLLKFFVHGGVVRVNNFEASIVTKFASNLDNLDKTTLGAIIDGIEQNLQAQELDEDAKQVALIRIAQLNSLKSFI